MFFSSGLNVYARSHDRAAFFRGAQLGVIFYPYTTLHKLILLTFPAYLAIPTDAANKMTRKFTHKVKRNFCIEIQWLGRRQKRVESTLLKNKTEICNRSTWKINFPNSTSYLRIDYGSLKAGEYELTLHKIKYPVARIDLCPGRTKKKIKITQLDYRIFFYAQASTLARRGWRRLKHSTVRCLWEKGRKGQLCHQLATLTLAYDVKS